MLKSRNFLVSKRIFIFITTFLIWFLTLDTISYLLHLNYLITTGVWMWTLNLDILYILRIDPLTILNHRKGLSLKGLYGISIVMSMISIMGSILSTRMDIDYILFVVTILFWVTPHRLYYTERYNTIDTLISSFGTEITITEVVLCDLMTSYSKIISMTVLESLWMVKPSLQGVYQNNRGRNSTVDVGVLMLVAFPYILRFRQCVVEFQASTSQKNIPFWNGIKYLSALPAIGLGYYMGEWALASKKQDYNPSHWSKDLIFWLWIVASLINTLGSLYWDVVMDWHLLPRFNVLVKAREFGILRQRIQFERYFYYTAILLNTILRFTWFLKTFTITLYNQEGLDAFLIGGEMFRRWIWVFLRLEREWFVINPVVIQTPPNEQSPYYVEGDEEAIFDIKDNLLNQVQE